MPNYIVPNYLHNIVVTYIPTQILQGDPEVPYRPHKFWVHQLKPLYFWLSHLHLLRECLVYWEVSEYTGVIGLGTPNFKILGEREGLSSGSLF